MATREKKAKRGFMDGYKTYDPVAEGFGSLDDWAASFKHRMGYDEAVATLDENDPIGIMGFKSLPTMTDLKARYRKLVIQHQACFLASASADEQKQAQRIIAAYTILAKRIGK